MKTEQIYEKLDFLEKELHKVKKQAEPRLKDNLALAVLKEALKKLKSKGITSFYTFDLYNETHLPIDQIARLVKKLEKQGIVS